MLRALADAPRGLTAPELAERFASSASSWVNALGSVRQLMLKQQRQGRVKQAGTVAGDRTRPSPLWRITEEGRRYVRALDDKRTPQALEGTMNCQALWEPEMRPRDTHDCRLRAGHEGDHQCSLCASWWDKPKRAGGKVTLADERRIAREKQP